MIKTTHLLFTTLIIPALLFAQQKKNYYINGNLTNAEGKKIYITQRGVALGGGDKVVYTDSAFVKNGKFTFSGMLAEPNTYAVLVENGKGWRNFMIDYGDSISINGDANEIWEAQVSGSKLNDDYVALRAARLELTEKMNAWGDSVSMAFRKKDTVNAKRFSALNQFYSRQQDTLSEKYMLSHPASFLSLYELSARTRGFGAERSKQLLATLSEDLQEHRMGQQLHYKLYEAEEIKALNAKALNFEEADPSGKLIALSDYKGKYVLIDFWASWCNPCRAENPFVKKAYKRYHDKGFEILGVSLDHIKKEWVTAIAHDKLVWAQVSDLNGWKNKIALQYDITAIPQNFLLDKEGKIIAKNLRGEKLEEQLTLLFGE